MGAFNLILRTNFECTLIILLCSQWANNVHCETENPPISNDQGNFVLRNFEHRTEHCNKNTRNRRNQPKCKIKRHSAFETVNGPMLHITYEILKSF